MLPRACLERHVDDASRDALQFRRPGGVAEWSKAAVLKTAVLARVPGVRIPSPPPRKKAERGTDLGPGGAGESTAICTSVCIPLDEATIQAAIARLTIALTMAADEDILGIVRRTPGAARGAPRVSRRGSRGGEARRHAGAGAEGAREVVWQRSALEPGGLGPFRLLSRGSLVRVQPGVPAENGTDPGRSEAQRHGRDRLRLHLRCTTLDRHLLAIMNVTRLLALTDDPTIAVELVRERAALRHRARGDASRLRRPSTSARERQPWLRGSV